MPRKPRERIYQTLEERRRERDEDAIRYRLRKLEERAAGLGGKK